MDLLLFASGQNVNSRSFDSAPAGPQNRRAEKASGRFAQDDSNEEWPRRELSCGTHF